MGGGGQMDVKKNIFVEEWNGNARYLISKRLLFGARICSVLKVAALFLASFHAGLAVCCLQANEKSPSTFSSTIGKRHLLSSQRKFDLNSPYVGPVHIGIKCLSSVL